MSYYINKFDIERSAVPRDYRSNVYYAFFSKDSIDYISEQITTRLTGTHPEGKNIIIPTDKIISVMDSIYQNTYRDVDKMIMMTISYIVDYIKAEYQIEQQNDNLNIWVTNFLPQYGMRQTPKIKLREKRPSPMIFNMNY